MRVAAHSGDERRFLKCRKLQWRNDLSSLQIIEIDTARDGTPCSKQIWMCQAPLKTHHTCLHIDHSDRRHLQKFETHYWINNFNVKTIFSVCLLFVSIHQLFLNRKITFQSDACCFFMCLYPYMKCQIFHCDVSSSVPLCKQLLYYQLQNLNNLYDNKSLKNIVFLKIKLTSTFDMVNW